MVSGSISFHHNYIMQHISSCVYRRAECIWGGEACWWQTACAAPIAIASLVSQWTLVSIRVSHSLSPFPLTLRDSPSLSLSLTLTSHAPISETSFTTLLPDSSSIKSTASLWPHIAHGLLVDPFRLPIYYTSLVRFERWN